MQYRRSPRGSVMTSFLVTRPDGSVLTAGPTATVLAIGVACYAELLRRGSISVRFGDGGIWDYRVSGAPAGAERRRADCLAAPALLASKGKK